jgi:RNA polymerase sigma factor (TIGR02999 family)
VAEEEPTSVDHEPVSFIVGVTGKSAKSPEEKRRAHRAGSTLILELSSGGLRGRLCIHVAMVLISSIPMSEISQLFEAASAGDRQAAAELLPLVYDELRKLAASRMASEKPGHTLDATALVHEAYLRLIGDQHFDGRGHFFAAAAEAMRRILVDHARAKRAEKRGDRAARADLDTDHSPAGGFDPDRWIDLDEALTRFAAIDPTAAELAKLRIFGGLSVEEAGEALGVPRATAFRTWTYARAWLTSRLADET